jgi:hypothetical protein
LALVTYRQFGDLMIDAEMGHQGATGATQVVQGEDDARGELQGVDHLGPAGNDTAGFL